MNKKTIIAVGIAIAIAVAAGAIYASSASIERQENNTNTLSSETEHKVKVIASFFPIFDFASNVGGDRAEVSSMIPTGIEPHDWEPTAQNLVAAKKADVLVLNGAGFEGNWVNNIETKFIVDTSEGIELVESGEAHIEEDEGFGGRHDPHIWLDPVLAKHQVEVIRDGFIAIDPDNADYYNSNAAKYIADLESLDASIRSELSTCEKSDFIAFHNAFSYFAKRYGLTSHSVHEGISPEGEVLPQRIREIKDLATQLGLDTVYSEDLVDPRLAEVIAGEIPNGRVLTLSPIEGMDREDQAQGIGYLEKMQENLESLKVGLKCQ